MDEGIYLLFVHNYNNENKENHEKQVFNNEESEVNNSLLSDSSSEDEDLSRFKEAVDTSFLKLIEESKGEVADRLVKTDQLRSERYLNVSTHYNDVKAPEELQKRIGAKISTIINKNIEFVDIASDSKKRKVKGGVKLFKDSVEYLSYEEPKDTYTESHNIKSKKIKNDNKKRNIASDVEELKECEKLKMAVVSGEYVLSKEETKLWKSRRKEKLFKYKSNGKSKVLTAIE